MAHSPHRQHRGCQLCETHKNRLTVVPCASPGRSFVRPASAAAFRVGTSEVLPTSSPDQLQGAPSQQGRM